MPITNNKTIYVVRPINVTLFQQNSRARWSSGVWILHIPRGATGELQQVARLTA
jgi:hypothetical protein